VALARPAANGAAPSSAAGASLLAAGGRHSCAAVAGGSVACWGANDRGQLGDGSVATRTSPTAVAGELSFVSVSVGLTHSCAVTRLGDVYCWGADNRGQLGDATTIRRTAPVRVAGLGTYVSVTAGVSHTCGVTTTGGLRCWGANDEGQLGDGTRDGRTVPTTVALGGLAAVAAAAGGQHSCAVTDDGRVHCWGADAAGQLGDGQPGGFRLTPGPVALSERAITVTAGLAHSCALTEGGAVWCWGRIESGQPAGRAPVAASGPTRLDLRGTSSVVQIVSGAAHSCARDAGGAVWCWGRNTRGALGDGTTAGRETPVRVALPAPAVAIAAGTAHSCAMTADGRTFCWGDNTDGQLGDASRETHASPVLVRYPAGLAPAVRGDAARPLGSATSPTATTR
jgi:alpha-tubulin suppressor-like RCC1 family protein